MFILEFVLSLITTKTNQQPPPCGKTTHPSCLIPHYFSIRSSSDLSSLRHSRIIKAQTDLPFPPSKHHPSSANPRLITRRTQKNGLRADLAYAHHLHLYWWRPQLNSSFRPRGTDSVNFLIAMAAGPIYSDPLWCRGVIKRVCAVR